MKTIFLFVALIITTTLSKAGCTPADDQTTYGTNSVRTVYACGGSSFKGSRVSFRISGGPALEITLTNFKGVFTDQDQVNLSWSTMMETAVDHFEIERTGDGMNFQHVDSIKSKMNITTNAYQLQYNYTDAHPLMGTSYYRVSVIGKNGTINQTPVVQIINTVVEGTHIYPTVVQNNTVFIESDKNLQGAKLEFFNLSGKKISETNWESLNGRENVQVSKSGILPPGTYLARLTANGQNVKSQLLIVRNF